MENSKYPWPRVRVGTTPETRQMNQIVAAFDGLTQGRHDRDSLAQMAELASDHNYPEMAATLRAYAQRGTP